MTKRLRHKPWLLLTSCLVKSEVPARNPPMAGHTSVVAVSRTCFVPPLPGEGSGCRHEYRNPRMDVYCSRPPRNSHDKEWHR